MKTDAEAAGFDEAALGRIDDHFRTRYIDPGKIAGCQLAIHRHGELAYFTSFGLADRERQRPMDEGTILRLYSMTKPIAGVALMQLYERGHFQLDDPISRHIPQWKGLKVRQLDADGHEVLVDQTTEMTVRNVMTHTGGLGYSATNGDLVLGEPMMPSGTTLATMVDVLAEAPLRYQPGSRWLYSLGMDICAHLVEKFSGMAFDDYLQTNLFEPLGMVDTSFTVPDDKVDRFAATYARNSRKELVCIDDPETSRYRRPFEFLSGGGGLVGTTADYLRFVRMLVDGGELDGRRVLSRKTVELMATNHLPGGRPMTDFADGTGAGETAIQGRGFGLTMAVSLGPEQTGMAGSVGDFMWGGAASTTFWADPVEKLGVVFTTQLMPSGTFNFPGQLRSLVYGALAD